MNVAVLVAVATAALQGWALQSWAHRQSSKTARETSRYNEKMLRREAEIEKNKAKAELEASSANVKKQRKNQQRLKSTQNAISGTAGSLNSGSALDVALDQEFEMQYDNALTLRDGLVKSNQAVERSTLLISKAEGEQWQRDVASKNNWMGYANAALSGINAGMSAYGASKTTSTSSTGNGGAGSGKRTIEGV